MTHLKLGSGGHLLINAAGHLVKECQSAVNICPGCDPPLKDQYQIVLAGLGGNFAPFNGTRVLTWQTPPPPPIPECQNCIWSCLVPEADLIPYEPAYITLWRNTFSDAWGWQFEWVAFVAITTNCHFDWTYYIHTNMPPPENVCDPTGDATKYIYAGCNCLWPCDNVPPTDCTLSAGATCEISECP